MGKTGSVENPSDRRKYVRATLVGSALVSPKSGSKAFTAVLDNVNKIGAGLHAKEKPPANEKVTVSLAFLDPDRVEQQEKLIGHCRVGEALGKGLSDRCGLGRIGDEGKESLVVLLPRRDPQVHRLIPHGQFLSDLLQFS